MTLWRENALLTILHRFGGEEVRSCIAQFCRTACRRMFIVEGIVMSLGNSLMSLSHRSRWILFSSVVDYKDLGTRLLPIRENKKPEEDLDAPFDNKFFQSAKRSARNGQP